MEGYTVLKADIFLLCNQHISKSVKAILNADRVGYYSGVCIAKPSLEMVAVRIVLKIGSQPVRGWGRMFHLSNSKRACPW